MSKYYHPTTLEHIRNPLPKVTEWASQAESGAPDYDPSSETCNYIDGEWQVATIQPEPEPVPQSITNGQARAALIVTGLFDSVQPAIDAITDDVQRKLVANDWEYRGHFERNNQTLIALAIALGLTDPQIDDLFRQAIQL